MITNYILVKLQQYFTIFDILRPIIQDLKRAPTLNGFRIVVAGRLTRKERAAYILRQHGSVTLGTKSRFIDYATDAKIMRFGVVGVKVWFHLRKFHPHSYNFRFIFKNKLIKK
jgi:ribosomal protein S3